MAQGIWDKTGLSAGEPVTDWSVAQQSQSTPSLSLVDVAGAEVNPVLFFDQTASFNNLQAIFDHQPESGQIEILTRFQNVRSGANDYGLQLAFFLDGSSSDDGYIRTQIEPEGNLRATSVQPFEAYASAALSENSKVGRWEWMRSRIDPTGVTGEVRIRSRWWIDGDPEPTSVWLIDVTTSPDAAVQLSGFSGVSGRSSDNDYYIDFWSWGTNGDTAPTAPLGPATPVNLGVTNLQATSARLTWSDG